MSDDIILLSSDDEFESPPPKRIKPTTIETEVLAKLNKLKEIKLKICEDNGPVIKTTTIQENDLTIIIEENNKSKENQNNVVNLVDDALEETVLHRSKNDSATSDCFVVGSDSEPEAEPKIEIETKETEIETKVAKEQNGVIEHRHQNGKEDKEETKNHLVDILNRPSTSKASESHKLFDEFLETCAKSLKGSKYECKVLPKFQKIKTKFEKCDNIHHEPNFKRMLLEYTTTARTSAPDAVFSFQRVLSYLLDNISGACIEMTDEDFVKIRKLHKTIKLLLKKLKKLEEFENNFEDDQNSAYIQIDRYSQRLTKVYDKYCQLLRRNPHAGRLMYERLMYVSSKYNEINRAVTKSFKTNHFPSYFDVEKCIRKCVVKNNLDLSEGDIKAESKDCFTSLGKLLQMRRKKELYEVHSQYITLNEDPAVKDDDLKVQLQQSLQEGDRKMKEVVEHYVKMQDNNVTVELSEDSDDSNYPESDSDAENGPAELE